MRPRAGWLLLCLAVLAACAEAPAPPTAAADPEAWADTLAAAYATGAAVTADPGAMTLGEAMAIQQALVGRLMAQEGPVVGYKAGLTSTAAQQRFGVAHPLRGVLLAQMMRPSGSTMPARFGARPLYEGDLLVRVGSTAINTAETDAELLAALDAVIPFLELPDLRFAAEVPLTGPAIAAANVGARRGIVGTPIVLTDTTGWHARLAGLRVTLFDTDGAVLAEGTGAGLLGHPLHAVRWLRDDLRAAGITLAPGHLLSLGSLTPLLAPAPGLFVTAVYEGLTPQPVDLTVQFR